MTLLITIVPSILMLLYFFLSDKFKEPKSTVAIVFFLGVLICLPAGIINTFVENNFKDQLSEKMIVSFAGPAWCEELLKFIILYTVVLRRSEFNEPMDGIVYGVAVSLGFATFENYEYVFYWAEKWEIEPYTMAIMRSYSAVPIHGLMGCVMGFYFGIYSFTANKKYLILSLFIPFLIHGLYNFLDYPFHFIIVGSTLIYALYLHSSMKIIQKHKKKENEKKII